MQDFIRHAYALSDGTPFTESATLARALFEPECAWVHMQADDPQSAAWVAENLGYLPDPVRAALTATEARPRAAVHGHGVLVILRGVNTNPGAEPEDMVSVRLWVEPERVVSMSNRELASVSDLSEAVRAGEGPRTAGELLAFLVERLNARLGSYVKDLDEEGDELEKQVLMDPDPALRNRVNDIRGELVDLRQFLVPQSDALKALVGARLDFIDEHQALRLSEGREETGRSLETVESLRDRLVVVKDELSASLDDRLNRNLYRLSVISAVFLPLGVLTGLMGINLAGMPGANWPPAFWVFTGLLGLIVLLQILILKKLNWL